MQGEPPRRVLCLLMEQDGTDMAGRSLVFTGEPAASRHTAPQRQLAPPGPLPPGDEIRMGAVAHYAELSRCLLSHPSLFPKNRYWGLPGPRPPPLSGHAPSREWTLHLAIFDRTQNCTSFNNPPPWLPKPPCYTIYANGVRRGCNCIMQVHPRRHYREYYRDMKANCNRLTHTQTPP
jgi:hypothetical protein